MNVSLILRSIRGAFLLATTQLITQVAYTVENKVSNYTEASTFVSLDFKQKIEISDKSIIIIYSHGTSNSQEIEECDYWLNQPPDSLLAIDKRENIYVVKLCSEATDNGILGSYIYKRVAEIQQQVDYFLSKGAQPNNLFLAGHSAGGWASLMAFREFGEKFNAVIAYAPACCGPKYKNRRLSPWLKLIEPQQISEMLEATNIRALVIAYGNDPYNKPNDLMFLKEKFQQSVTILGYSCLAGHDTHIGDCKEVETSRKINDFISSSVESPIKYRDREPS